MKYKMLEAMRNMQLFAEGAGAGAGDPGNGGGTAGNGGAGSSEGDGGTLLSFDDFLKQEGNQAEFDRRVQKAIDTAVSNAQKKWNDLQAFRSGKAGEDDKRRKGSLSDVADGERTERL